MLNSNWIKKLTIECIDEEDGSMSINIEWDETDPDLAYWNSLGKEGQEKIFLDALSDSIKKYSTNEA